MARWSCSIAFAIFVLLAAWPSRGEEARLAISGYDPVAYFTDGKPVPGQSEFEYTWHNARWRFASAAHRDAFAGNPDRYAPQYDGYCSMGVTGVSVAAPHKDTVDPEAWAIVDGKLYLTHTRGSLGSVEIWDSPKRDIVIQAWDGPICAKRRPGENGTALPGQEIRPRSQR